MTETYTDPAFEASIGPAISRLGGAAVRSFDPRCIARAAMAADSSPSTGRVRAGGRSMGLRVMVTAVAALALAVVALGLSGGRTVPRPPEGSRSFVTKAVLSPDGTQIAFLVGGRVGTGGGDSEYRELYVVGADGSDLRLLMHDQPGWDPLYGDPGALVWSADGDHLALQVAGPHHDGDQLEAHVAVVDVGGGAPTIVTRQLPDGGVLAGWSPSRDRLLVNTYRRTDNGSDAYVVDPDGRGLAALTTSHLALADSWSPDGSAVLIEERSEAVPTVSTLDTSWVVTADGSSRRPVPDGMRPAGWLPDGSLLLVSDDPGASPRPLAVRSDGSDPRPFPMAAGVTNPVWSHDGTTFAAVADRGQGIVLGHPDGSHMRLTDGPADAPLWSPRDDLIAFLGTRREGTGAFVVHASGGNPKLVAPNATPIGWSVRDGQERLAVIRDGAIESVGVDDAATRSVVPRSAISALVSDPLDGARLDDRIVIASDGPERDIYHVAMAPSLSLDVENRTDEAWLVLIDEGWFYHPDCHALGTLSVHLAMAVRPPAGDRVPATMSVDDCLVPPHATVTFDVPHDVLGPVSVLLQPQAGPGGSATQGDRLVILDFKPSAGTSSGQST